jgi:phosphoglycerol transferase MdoB-like AlkP superfamily enzyme
MSKIILVYITLFTLLFTIIRLSYLFLYHSTLRVNLIINYFYVFFNGLRFDLSSIFFLLFPFILLSFYSLFNNNRTYKKFWTYPLSLILSYTLFHLIGDFIYFQNAQKHLGYEGFVFFGKDFIVLLESAFKSHFWLLFFGFPFGFILSYKLIKFIDTIEVQQNINTKRKIFEILIWVITSILFIRGGFQKSFISPSNAIVTEDPLLNQFVLNGVFTTIHELRTEQFPRMQEMNLLESITVVRNVIHYNGADFVNDVYPIYRKTNAQEKMKKPNILMVLLESWPAKYVLQDYKGKEITPNFNKIVSEGMYYSKFFANGGRTSNGLVSIFSGVPDRSGKSLVHSRYSLNHFTSLPKLLNSKGYETYFYYGGELAFENLTPVIRHWGFQKLYDFNSFERDGEFKKGVWGYNDSDVFTKIMEDINNDKSEDPKFRVCLTLSTHHPFQVPSSNFNIFPPEDDEDKFINSLYYADWSLGKFIHEFKKSDKYKDTIIILVSDHTSHRNLNYFEDRNIPFLILNYNSKGESQRVSSQLDILPTILGMVGGEFYFSSFGKDIFRDTSSGNAYIAFGNIYGWAEENTLFMDTVEDYNAINLSIFEPYKSRGACKDMPLECEPYHIKAKAFLNLNETLLKKNLVAPY